MHLNIILQRYAYHSELKLHISYKIKKVHVTKHTFHIASEFYSPAIKNQTK